MTDAGLMPCNMIPVAVGGGLSFTQLAGGGAHTCALTSDGTAHCWGDNADGQLGDNSTTDRTAPVPVATLLKFVSIDAGAAHTCALTSTGAAHCWGRNIRGQLGDGTTTPSLTPVSVSGGHTFQQIAAGGFFRGHTCALDLTGAAWCWGDNDLGQLGIGTSDLDPHPLPELVSGGLVFSSLTAGLGRHGCGLTGVGDLWCWGENSFGALGNRTRRNSSVPVPVSGRLTFIEVVAGGFIGHTCALALGGDAYCWGDNEVGQVGDGTTADRWVPAAVDGGFEFSSIDAGFRHSCARATAGAVYCWGANGAGQLGNNSNLLSSVPVKVFGQP
jgi:alpha-tubulin suppressor-like RCC1 family protein